MILAYFSQIKPLIMQYIEKATSEICIAVAWFTHRDLFDAILKALDRKIRVSVILIDDIINRGPNGLDFAVFISKGGMVRFMNTRKLLMHNKFCLFDGKTLITGSYNWTYSAEMHNAENIIATDEANVCIAFREQFELLWNDLPAVEQYSHIELNEVKSEDFLNCFDYLHDEYESMEQVRILKPYSVADVDNLKKDISITKLNTIITNTKRAKPILKANISVEFYNNHSEVIIKGGQELPFTKSVEGRTVHDNQTSADCNILFGNYEEANKNQTLVKLKIEDLPKPSRAGEIGFLNKVTIDTNGYMHIEFVCTSTGVSKSEVKNVTDLINYQ